MLSSLSACAGSDVAPAARVETELRCPALAPDIIAESRRVVPIEGQTWEEIAGRLKLSAKAKNRSLKRAVASYEACRKT
jgi:hypothetical protein